MTITPERTTNIFNELLDAESMHDVLLTLTPEERQGIIDDMVETYDGLLPSDKVELRFYREFFRAVGF